ncbi:hypothetical protein QFC20_002270 [Naganishia adeliensis]|uniref:Uncharacterized protein n=1 Tax=Naganishia adeliensis TaxID=92952 RepID=A0ACC2WL75_9TREE|nr:hypothetical protein QFC20_002270 [Naganishia adeliensis]
MFDRNDVVDRLVRGPIAASTAEDHKFIYDDPPPGAPIFLKKPAEQFWPHHKHLEFTPQRWMFNPAYLESDPDIAIAVAPMDEPTSVLEVKESEWYAEHVSRVLMIGEVKSTPTSRTRAGIDSDDRPSVYAFNPMAATASSSSYALPLSPAHLDSVILSNEWCLPGAFVTAPQPRAPPPPASLPVSADV